LSARGACGQEPGPRAATEARQPRQHRAKAGKQVTAIAVAEKKARLFDETLARFVAKLERLVAARRIADLKAAVRAAWHASAPPGAGAEDRRPCGARPRARKAPAAHRLPCS